MKITQQQKKGLHKEIQILLLLLCLSESMLLLNYSNVSSLNPFHAVISETLNNDEEKTEFFSSIFYGISMSLFAVR